MRRRHCVGGGAPVNFGRRRQRGAAQRGLRNSPILHTCSKAFEQRTSVIKVCMLNNYFWWLSGLKFEKNIIKTGLQ